MSHEITKENIDEILKDLGKEFRKQNGTRQKAELIIVGGASVVLNYGFRNSTEDIDAYMHTSSAMADAVSIVGDKYDLPPKWLNSEFTRTESFSPKIEQYSQYYRTFSNVLEVRTIEREYLVAMKLKSFRDYKTDKSDIVGIMRESGTTKEAVMRAFEHCLAAHSPSKQLFRRC